MSKTQVVGVVFAVAMIGTVVVISHGIACSAKANELEIAVAKVAAKFESVSPTCRLVGDVNPDGGIIETLDCGGVYDIILNEADAMLAEVGCSRANKWRVTSDPATGRGIGHADPDVNCHNPF